MKNSPRHFAGDEIANVNFLDDDIVRALQNTIDSCMNSATDRRGYVLERRFTILREITQCNGRSRSFKVTDCGTDQKLICLLTSYSYTVSKLWLITGQIFVSERGTPHFNALARGDPCQYRHK